MQTTLGEATTSATELGDLLSAGLAADDQQRHAESGAPRRHGAPTTAMSDGD